MKSESLFERAQRVTPAGVNSRVRAFRAAGGVPLFFERAAGAYLWDADRRRYIDYVGSWGPMVAGHSHPAVVEAVQEAASRALSFGAPTEAEVELAEMLCRLVPSLDQVRLVSSGTEATMTAIRDRKSTRLNSSHLVISYAVFCLKKKKKKYISVLKSARHSSSYVIACTPRVVE